MDNKEIGNRIKTRRKELSLTLNDIGNIVGVASSTIQRYENGTISQYKLPVLESIAKALNVNPTWLVREDAPMNIPNIINTPLTSGIEITNNNIKNLKESKLVNIFNKLNETGKKEAIKRVSELTEINKYTTLSTPAEDKSHLIAIAAHDDNLTDDEKNIMDERINEALKAYK